MAPERIDRFRTTLLKLRYPASILGFFCFSQSYQTTALATSIGSTNGDCLSQFGELDLNSADLALANGVGPLQTAVDLIQMERYYGQPKAAKEKEKAGTDVLAKFAKNTLRKAGLMPRKNNNAGTAAAVAAQHLAIRTPETMRKAMRGRQNNELDPADVHGHRQQNSLQVDSDEENLSG